MENKFNQRAYKNEWRKAKKSQVNIELDKEEKADFDKLLKNENITKTDFLRESIFEFKKRREIEMNRYDVINFIKRRRVKERENFEEDFALGNYSNQNQNLEGTHVLSDGSSFFTIVLKTDDFAYISVEDEEGYTLEDGYVTYEAYEELIDAYEKAYNKEK